MKEQAVMNLTAKDDKFAYAYAEKIISESQETDEWYEYFFEFAALLNHPKSFVRNRALYILASNAQWDEANRFDSVLPDILSHITDEKPVTARQCIKALAQVGQAKPQYIPRILSALQDARRPERQPGQMRAAVQASLPDHRRTGTERKLSAESEGYVYAAVPAGTDRSGN